MRSLIAAIALCLCAGQSLAESSFSTDASDLWSNLNEQGWGVNVIQQNEILFITFFVYSPSGSPAWYVGSATSYVGNQGSSLIYSGPLYQTSGPWFGGQFNPAAVGNRQVGTVTFTLDSVSTATIAYSVDGVSISKQIERQTWRNNNISGSYLGATIGTYSGCGAGSGYLEEPATITVTQSGSNVTIIGTGTTATCTYSGQYSQSGRMGSITGNLACNNGGNGTFQAFEIEAGISGLTGRAMANFGGGCTWSGRIGGLRRGS
jgi:hypothetical protein